MQKKLMLASAIAGVLAAPTAFADAALYGHLDIGVQRVDPGSGYQGSKIFLNDQQGSGGSYLGVKATDDIGGGLKGLVVAEIGFFTDTGTFDNTSNQLFQRQVYAGLQGDWGTLTAGRQYRELFLIGNAAAYNYTAAALGVLFLNANTGVRQDNHIKYMSPSFGGVTLGLGYSPGEGTTSTAKDDKFTEFSAKWSAGPLSVGAAMGTATASSVDTKTTIVGGQYSFGPTTLYALYSKSENDVSTATSNRTAISLGGKYTIGNGDVVLQIGQSTDDRSGVSDADSKLLGVAYYHRLSKMTTVYTAYGTMSNDTNATLSLPRQAVATTAAGEDPNTLSFGIRRFF